MKNRTFEQHVLTRNEAAVVCSVLVTRLGGSYSRLLGIRLARMESDETFKWFAAALLIGSPVPAAAAFAAYRELEARDVLTPQSLFHCGEGALITVMAGANVGRYSRRVAVVLHSACGSLITDYDSDINRLHFFAEDNDDLIERLRRLGTGMPRRTVGLFLREMKGVWDKARPRLSPSAFEAALRLGLTAAGKAERMSEALDDVWEEAGGAGRTYADFEVALVRLGEHYCSARKCICCPMKKLCVARFTEDSEHNEEAMSMSARRSEAWCDRTW